MHKMHTNIVYAIHFSFEFSGVISVYIVIDWASYAGHRVAARHLPLADQKCQIIGVLFVNQT